MTSTTADPSLPPLWRALRAILFQLDPERAHDVALKALEWPGVTGAISPRVHSANDPVHCMGLEFANRIGLAAGLDKNGDHIDALGALGFGHIEIGTVTPKAQAGNPKPRMFRLVDHEALINRMGFNNKGVAHLVRQAESRQWGGVLGINIGKNASTPNERAADDYIACLDAVWPVADYVTVNISSPNTAGLRDLQHGRVLRELLDAIANRADALSAQHSREVPIMIKIAPDMDDEALADFITAVAERAIAGVIVGNTTQQRDVVAGHRFAAEAGGLSGKPLQALADTRLRAARACLDERQSSACLVGVGGVHNASSAAAKCALGANLVQLYTGFIYGGPALVRDAIEATKNH